MSNLSLLRKPSTALTFNFTGITSDQILTWTNPDTGMVGDSLLYIGDVDWERIVLDIDVTSFTGTNVIFKLKTCNKRGGTAIAATTMDAKNGAGANVASSTITAVGRELVTVARFDTDNGASNIGGFIGIYADVNSVSVLAGTISVFVGK